MKTAFPILLFAMLASSSLFAQPDFKIIGYLPSYRFALSDQIDYSKLTHLNLAFANPDANGNLSFNGQAIEPVIRAAHQQGAQVYLSLAGGALTPAWASAWRDLMKADKRSAFIHQIIQYAQDNDFDGVDMDLEWGNVDELYSPFVLELKDSLIAHNLPMTAALPGTTRYADITPEALAAFDWINMMVYDFTGPWAPNNPGQHSSMAFAQQSMNYWAGQGMATDQLTLGVPFYGYDFTNPANVVSVTYQSMVAQDVANAHLDQVGQIYYNGIPTIKAKTALAKQQLSGIMIWELGQDAFDDYSLLKTIHDALNPIVSVPEVGPVDLAIYPNPFVNDLVLENKETTAVQWQLSDIHGRILLKKEAQAFQKERLDLSHLEKGFYILSILGADSVQSIKLIKSN